MAKLNRNQQLLRNLRSRLENQYTFVPSSIVGQEIRIGTHNYTLMRLLQQGEQGRRGYAYEALCESSGHRVCCKLYYRQLLEGTPNWQQEFTKPNRVQSDDFANYVFHDDCEFNGIKFTWIAYTWIRGVTLENFIKAHPDKINIAFVLGFLKWILGPLIRLKQSNSSHGDLHTGNIMVTEGSEEDIPPNEIRFKLIDFGVSASVIGLSTRSDYISTAKILAQLLTRISFGKLGFRDRYIYDHLRTYFLKLLAEEEPTSHQAVGDPMLLYKELRSIEEESQRAGRSSSRKIERLESPFEILSADKFPEDSPLLQKLFSRSIPGYHYLESKDTVLITGPRGCGKTMILRNMALKTYLANLGAKLSDLPDFFGIYLSSYELWVAFPRRRADDEQPPEAIATDDYQRQTLHYFHLCLMEEVLSTLEYLVRRFGDEIISPEEVEKIAEFINSNFRPYRKSPSKNILSDLKSNIESWRANYKRRPKLSLTNEDPGFLRDFCRCLRDNVPFLSQRKIFFLLDDYSLGKITSALQLSLNRVIFQRIPEFEFKISAEKEALLLRDTDGPLDPSRYYYELDIGYHFVSSDSSKERLSFLSEVFNNRLRWTENVKTKSLQAILGRTKYKDFKQFAEVIADRYKPRKRDDEILDVLKKPAYHGIQHLAEICSGDVAAMISLVQNIFIEANFDYTQAGQKEIEPKVQDAAIKNYSRRFLENVGGERKYSQEARHVAKAFGEMAEWKLKNQTSENEGVLTPFQASRLEIYEDSSLNPRLEEFYKHLLRYGIFIQEPRGFGQGETTSRRLYFRRLFLPSFNLSFSRRDCVRLHMKDFKKLLEYPTSARGKFIARWKRGLELDDGQMEMEFDSPEVNNE